MTNLHGVALIGMLVSLWGRPALAQERPDPDRVADLGITISCDCTVNSIRTRPWVFRSPIVVAGVDARGASRDRLQVGDRILEVNGHALTTEAGARALMSLPPGRVATFGVERDGRALRVEVTPGVMRASDRDAIGAYAPVPVVPRPHVGPVPSPVSPRAAPPTPTPPGGVTPTPPSPPRAVRVPVVPDLQPRGWLGFGLACSHCGLEIEEGDTTPRWEFTSPPVVYGVEGGSPAAAAGLRENDRITHVNGFEVTDERAGAALGGVRPGQTLRFRIEREGAARDVALTAGRRPPPEAYRPPLPTPPLDAPAPAAPTPPPPVRYEGRLGAVDIEVRGVEPVAVEVRRDTNEVVIRTRSAVVTLVLDD